MRKLIVLAKIHLDKNRFKEFFEKHLAGKFKEFEIIPDHSQLEKKVKEGLVGEVAIGCMLLERWAEKGDTVDIVEDIKKLLAKIPLTCYKQQADPRRLEEIEKIEESPISFGITFY